MGQRQLNENDLAINEVIVKTASDLPQAIGGFHTLEDNTSYRLNGTINLGTNYILCGVSNFIYGIDKSNDGIIYTGTGGAIRSTDQDIGLWKFFITASTVGAKAFDLVGSVSLSKRVEVAELVLSNCDSVGDFSTGFDVIVFRNNLVFQCANGITFEGSDDDVFIIDNIFSNMNGTATMVSFGSGNYDTIIISRNYIEVAAGQVGIADGALTFASSGLIASNSFAGPGTKLTGFNANTEGWLIASKSNYGIAGLFETSSNAVNGTYSSTTNGVWLSVPEQPLLKEFLTDYEPFATDIEATLTVAISHTASGGSVGFRLINWTDNTVVANSTVNSVIITTGGVYEIVSTGVITLIPNKQYRVQIIKNAGTGSQNVLISNAILDLKIF